MQVDSLMVKDGAASYYTDSMRNTLEDFMTKFRSSIQAPTTIAPTTAERFAGDLFGLLTFLNIPMSMHYAIMRVNKLNSSDEYQPWMTSLLVPSQADIQRIQQTNNSTNRATT